MIREAFLWPGLIGYLSQASLPSHFDTPMFWSDEELAELRGTSVIGTSSHGRLLRIIVLMPNLQKKSASPTRRAIITINWCLQ